MDRDPQRPNGSKKQVDIWILHIICLHLSHRLLINSNIQFSIGCVAWTTIPHCGLTSLNNTANTPSQLSHSQCHEAGRRRTQPKVQKLFYNLFLCSHFCTGTDDSIKFGLVAPSSVTIDKITRNQIKDISQNN